jgi:hypothetical protein
MYMSAAHITCWLKLTSCIHKYVHLYYCVTMHITLRLGKKKKTEYKYFCPKDSRILDYYYYCYYYYYYYYY